MGKLEKPVFKPVNPEIIVKFREGGRMWWAKGRLSAEHLYLKQFYKTLGDSDEIKVRKSVSLDPDLLKRMCWRAILNLGHSISSLDLFVRLNVPPFFPLNDLLQKLNEDPEIEYACLAGYPAPPPSDDYSSQQGYLKPATEGIDAQHAWTLTGGKGSGVNVAVLDDGFNPNHEDLQLGGSLTVINQYTIDSTIYDADLTLNAPHGTAVLGILAAIDNGKGITGICHEATFTFASTANSLVPLAHIVTLVSSTFSDGDIILIEKQLGGFPLRPAEGDPDVHTSIATAVGNNKIVIEVAGNGSTDLASTANVLGNPIWDTSEYGLHPEYDSKAILVGAGASTDHTKITSSNYGDRIDCQGWGDGVVTCGGNTDLNNVANAEYTGSFGDTSAAAAIVAGAAACLQGIQKAYYAMPLTPTDVRDILSNDANGTPQPPVDAALHSIGPLPDLDKAVQIPELVPDVFLRDYVGDTGEPHTQGCICQSPDLVVRQNPINPPDVEAVLGESQWDNNGVSENVELGLDNYIYVRLQNCGATTDTVGVQLYYARFATFLDTPNWVQIGTIQNVIVIPGTHVVAGPYPWAAADLPPQGHHCMIGVVRSDADPIEIPASFSSATEYMDFIRLHNNIAYRNITVEDLVSSSPVPAPKPVTFHIQGLGKMVAPYGLVVRHRLPRGAQVDLELHKRLLDRAGTRIIKKRPSQPKRTKTGEIYTSNKTYPMVIEPIFLGGGESVPVEIRVINWPKRVPFGEYLITAEQYLEKKRIGQVNVLLRLKKRQGA